ncbi:M1 family metallopeptidase [Yimella sp. cx-51]|uniref:M1 family metallopeptidase n=1 Tax=Yimella sp. cx-51 TaxID=2770551 RepID=UPI00165E683F|nr:M1 family metallopeptidase [Yimella sp. cx-51]MBC9956637.1 M1 family metallopeptidase [Yimella sp. cx-51]QTH38266.1 M1 family metallopeptidase [Yimella sp. cx-51]
MSPHRTPVDPYLPGHGDASYEVQHYDLDLDYALENNILSGRATLQIRALKRLSEVTLDLHHLKVVKVTGPKISKYEHRNGRLRIKLAKELDEGDRASLTVTYRGVPKPVRDEVGDAGWEELTDGVIVAAQPGGAPSWFPCNDRTSDKATYSFKIATNPDYLVVCNGIRTGTRRRAGRVEWTYEQRQPMATYLATVQIGRYVEIPIAADIPMSAAIPPSRRRSYDNAFADQGAMFEFFTRTFGPYPFDVYRVVITDEALEIPLEAQSLSIFGTNFLNRQWDSQRLIAHELSHQWFGNAVTMETLQDIWLHEGFACYSEWLWSQESGGPSTAEKAAHHHAALLRKPQNLVLGSPGIAEVFDDRVYKRGALTVHAVRCRLGDEAFFDLLRAWIAEHNGENVTTADFVAFTQAHTGVAIDDLIDAWVYRTELPELPVTAA